MAECGQKVCLSWLPSRIEKSYFQICYFFKSSKEKFSNYKSAYFGAYILHNYMNMKS